MGCVNLCYLGPLALGTASAARLGGKSVPIWQLWLRRGDEFPGSICVTKLGVPLSTSSEMGRGLCTPVNRGDKMAAPMSIVEEIRTRVILQEFGVKNVRHFMFGSPTPTEGLVGRSRLL